MSRENQYVLYEQILDDTDQLIQISDMETFSMMYANKPACTFSKNKEEEYRGEHCYKYMMGLDEQCPFCPMKMLGDNESGKTEVDNGVQVFAVKTKRIIWEGKEAFIEYATDITTSKRAQQIFESQMETLIKSIPNAQGIFHVNLTTDEFISANGSSNNVKKFTMFKNVDSLFEGIAKYIPDEKMYEEFLKTYRRNELINNYNHGKNEIVQEVLSYFDDGSIRWARLTARLIMNPQTGQLECIFYGMDIHDEKEYCEKMKKVEREKQEILEKSKRDVLTDTYSKKAFEQLASEYINSGFAENYAIVFIDMDYFKNINDKLGHLAGDKAIIETAERIKTFFSNKDIVSRFGGDEFCVLVKSIPKATLIEKMDFLLNKLEKTYYDDKNNVLVSASIGVAFCENGIIDVQTLIDVADVELYKAKKNGRNQYCIKLCQKKS